MNKTKKVNQLESHNIKGDVGEYNEIPQFRLHESGAIEFAGDKPDPPLESEAKMLAVFGTTSRETLNHHVEQIAKASGCQNGEQAVKLLNQMIPIIKAIGPKNDFEATLAVQMVGIHLLATNMMGRAMLPNQTADGVNLFISQVAKLTRTFTAQMEALNKHRGKGQQKMTIKHVHINSGGQAIIGDVKRGEGKNEK